MATKRASKRLYSTVLVEDGKGKRRSRKARERAAQQVIARDRSSQLESEKARVAAERAAARSTDYLPKGGEPGAAALRSYRRFRVPTHQDTSATLQGAYPFLAEGGLGSQGVFVGQVMFQLDSHHDGG